MLHKADQLLQKAIDMHYHGYPEMSLVNTTRLDDLEAARHCEQAGMRGLVLKSHTWPTIHSAFYVQQQLHDFKVFGSITLNACSGGISPWAVEMAAREGARAVWMPTWSANYDLKRPGLAKGLMRGWIPSISSFPDNAGLTVLDVNGRLLTDVVEVLRLVKELDMVLSTGHLSPVESLALAGESQRMEYRKLIFCHPHAASTRATDEQMAEMARLGAYIEICGMSTMPLLQWVKPKKLLETVRAVGAERCILTTDSFFNWSPPPAETLRMHIGLLLGLGATEEEISIMVQRNPAYLLGLT